VPLLQPQEGGEDLVTVNKIRRNGSYAPLSAHYYKDDAIQEAGEKAEVLFTRGMAFCADVLSDGFISDRQLRIVGVGLSGVTKRAEALAAVGLWRRDQERGGYWLTSWLKWNRSRDEIEMLAKTDRGRKSASSSTEFSTGNSERNPNGVRPDSEPRARSSISTTRQDQGGHAGVRASPAADRPLPTNPPPLKCPRHIDDPNPPNCGHCADARRAHDQWATKRADAERSQPRCELHRGQPAHNCAGCRADQLVAEGADR
jgi:hypothetical protein